MSKRFFTWLGGTWWSVALLALLAIGAYLRFDKLYETATFLGDQGRDAIVMKYIATLKDLPALGPITSVGSIYLGPLYYYIMAPWLLLTGLNPIGPAIGIAFITTAALYLQYLVVKEMLNKTTALLSVAFATVSWALVEYSRFSWNPNLLPQVALFSTYALYKIKKTNQLRYYALHGFLLSLAVQLHYLALFLFPLSFAVIIHQIFFSKKKKPLSFTKQIASLKAGFFIPFAPFIIFEVIKGFPNLRSILRFSNENSGSSDTPYFNEISDTLRSAYKFALQIDVSQPWAWIITLALVALFVYAIKKKLSLAYILAAMFSLLIGISFYKGPKYTHYLGGTYLLFYAALSYVIYLVFRLNRYAGLALIAVVFYFFLSWNLPKYYFYYEREHQNQIDKAEKIAETIMSFNPQTPYTITTSPDAYADYPYRYFLDKMNRKPVTKEQDSYVQTKELFVVCENECEPMKDPQWAIAHFNPKQIESVKTVEKYPWYKVYKLTK